MSLNFSPSGIAVVPRGAGLRPLRLCMKWPFCDSILSHTIRLPRAAVAGTSTGPRGRTILDLVRLTHSKALQIDFDAPESARPFYRDLLVNLRSRLPRDTFISITALVSWCMESKSWLAALPVDEYVPMVFDMGTPGDAVLTLLKRGGDFSFPGCRTSLGIQQGSRDLPSKPGVRGIYRFSRSKALELHRRGAITVSSIGAAMLLIAWYAVACAVDYPVPVFSFQSIPISP